MHVVIGRNEIFICGLWGSSERARQAFKPFFNASTTTRTGWTSHIPHPISLRPFEHSHTQRCRRDHTAFAQGINSKDLNASISTVLSKLPTRPGTQQQCVTSQAAPSHLHFTLLSRPIPFSRCGSKPIHRLPLGFWLFICVCIWPSVCFAHWLNSSRLLYYTAKISQVYFSFKNK